MHEVIFVTFACAPISLYYLMGNFAPVINPN